MSKTYINNAVIGNSSMLGCMTDRGELVRLFWPHIDYPQHIEKMAVGIFYPGRRDSTSWLDSDSWQCTQRYAGDTNILETVYVNQEKGLRISQTDFVLPDRDVMVRHYEMENIGNTETEPGFMLYSSGITTNPHLSCVLFDFKSDALVHYRHNYYISISSDREARQFQLGNNAYQCAQSSELKGNDSIGMMQDGAVSWMPGKLCVGGKLQFTIHICASHTLKGVKDLAKEMRYADSKQQLQETTAYWVEFLKNAREIKTGNEAIDVLYRRSVLVFKLMSDEKTGGLMAAPEIDEDMTKCGRYAYCWGRDAAFITSALDACGLYGAVDKFYRWAAMVQDEDGSWQQRYHMDGNLAPSWGLQVDETGTILWGILKHYEKTGNMVFLCEMWECVKKGVAFLLEYIDAETGLPALSFDLWEERLGEHAYSSAAVYGGIMAGVRIGKLLEVSGELLEEWRDGAEKIKAAISKNFWKQEWNRFIRSVRIKLNPWGEENTQDRVFLKVNAKENYRDFTREDGAVDISLLGLCIPFGVYGPDHPGMAGTADVVERVLAFPASGGLKRYENDWYIGGNPWVIATLWAALYQIEKKDYIKARHYFDWAVNSRTELGFLPEQVDRDTGKPGWVIALTWSHAMFVLVLEGLLNAGEL